MSKQVVILGGGAAGFFCAVNVARMAPGLRVIVLEKQNKVLQKVKVSGGGRCNVTHACFQPAELIKRYPRGRNFLKKVFPFFGPKETIAWFEERGVPLKTEADGRMFPESNTSQTIIDCLLQEASKYKIDLRLQCDVVNVEKKDEGFLIQLKNKDSITADFVVMAAGGFPKIESYDWLIRCGHTIELPLPSLFTFNTPQSPLNELMGVAVEKAVVKIESSKLEECGPVLITHWGLSGPAILRLSAWGARELAQQQYHFTVIINWLGQSEQQIRDQWNAIRNKQGANTLGTKNPFELPKRLWEFCLHQCDIDLQTRWSELNSKAQNRLIHLLTTHKIAVSGKTTFKEEFVTCGGVSLSQIEAKTMESSLLKDLFFCGEIMDVDGITGGFNFQHAWSSGYIAAQTIANKVNE